VSERVRVLVVIRSRVPLQLPSRSVSDSRDGFFGKITRMRKAPAAGACVGVTRSAIRKALGINNRPWCFTTHACVHTRVYKHLSQRLGGSLMTLTFRGGRGRRSDERKSYFLISTRAPTFPKKLSPFSAISTSRLTFIFSLSLCFR